MEFVELAYLRGDILGVAKECEKALKKAGFHKVRTSLDGRELTANTLSPSGWSSYGSIIVELGEAMEPRKGVVISAAYVEPELPPIKILLPKIPRVEDFVAVSERQCPGLMLV